MVDSITEDSLEACIKERSTVQKDKYDLAYLEKQLHGLKMDNKVSSLVTRLWKLDQQYEKMLCSINI